ncbi:MAG: bifunctional folylpolyglutamate synthase/dihydrofolate synthase [Acidimicrobiia bacterium]|nr:bifunctional folylpolyglutamate synthase/dihydrofolate synthase [Acidimicrobiia bacterium]
MSNGHTALDYLLSLEQFGIKFGLDNMQALVEALGHPEREYQTIHVAGTNGKGSVTAMVDAALRAAGYRSARYTSPHLRHLSERFAIDGAPVSTDVLERAAVQLRETVGALMARGRLLAPPTFFEATTAIAFGLFREARVDVAVCEVGLGGRLDATNVLSPAVTAITSIGFDHEEYLGSTLQEIASEKAGIIKAGVPVIVGEMPSEAFQRIAKTAAKRGAPLVRASGGSMMLDQGPTATGGRRVLARTPVRDYGAVALALAGEHQVGNALVAIRVLEALSASAGMSVPNSAVTQGLETVQWPGRLDWRTLPDGRHLLLDAAHNPEGARALARFLASSCPSPPALVFAAMRDKDAGGMLGALAPHVHTLLVTRARTARSADPDALAAVARDVGVPCRTLVEPSLDRALADAWLLTPTIVVAGSIYLLGDVMEALGLS